MKILIYIHDMHSEAMEFIAPQILYLDKQGVEVYLLCHRQADLPVQDYCKIIHFPWKINPLKKRWRHFLWRHDFAFKEQDKSFAAYLDLAIKDINPDLIHGHYVHETIRLYQNLPSTYKGKIIWHFYGVGLDTILSKRSFRKQLQIILNQSNTFGISESDFVIQQLKQKDLSVFNLKRINTGIDLEVYKPIPTLSHPNKILLQISQDGPGMGHSYFLKALAKFIRKHPDQGVKYIYTASALENVNILKHIEDLNLGPYCEVLHLEEDENKLLDYLSQAHVFVYPKIKHKDQDEGQFPKEVIQALAMELPVLATQQGGISEIIAHDVNGILVPQKNIKALEKGIEEILQWPKLKRNREKVSLHFNIQLQIQSIYQLYQEITSK